MNARLAAIRPLIAVFLLGLAAAAYAQNPISIRLEIFVVSEVTTDDGEVEERFSEATTARPGQIVEYRLFATNDGDTTLPAGTVVILGPIPEGTSYVENSTTPSSERVITEFSADGREFSEPPVVTGPENDRVLVPPSDYEAVRWTLLVPMEPGQEEVFFYRVMVE